MTGDNLIKGNTYMYNNMKVVYVTETLNYRVFVSEDFRQSYSVDETSVKTQITKAN